VRRARRLPGGTAFDAVFREGTVLNSPFFVVRFRPNDGEGPRWGVAVGKKLAPKAVDRNYLRRRIKSMAEKLDPGALDVVVVAKAGMLRADYAELERTLAKLASRMRRDGARA
jgi:ribonuclease P protein component